MGIQDNLAVQVHQFEHACAGRRFRDIGGKALNSRIQPCHAKQMRTNLHPFDNQPSVKTKAKTVFMIPSPHILLIVQNAMVNRTTNSLLIESCLSGQALRYSRLFDYHALTFKLRPVLAKCNNINTVFHFTAIDRYLVLTCKLVAVL